MCHLLFDGGFHILISGRKPQSPAGAPISNEDIRRQTGFCEFGDDTEFGWNMQMNNEY